MVKLSADDILEYFFFFFVFFQETGVGISCEFSPLETVCVRCRDLFSVDDGGGVVDLSSAELAKRVVKVSWCEGLFPFFKYKREISRCLFIISGSQ